ADQFHKLHHRHRIHEMKPDELFRPVGRRGEPGDRYGRGIGSKDGGGLQDRADFLEDLPLDLFLFGRGLNCQVNVAEWFIIGGERDASQALGHLLFADAVAVDLAAHIVLYGLEAGFRPLHADVLEDDIESRERADMGDTVAHLPCANDTDFIDHKLMYPAQFRTLTPLPGLSEKD